MDTPNLSEKEEQQSKNKEVVEPVRLEVPPSSSPEGVFQPDEPILDNIDNIPQDNHVEQIEHQVSIADTDNAHLLADPNSIVITPEDLYEAGIEAENLDDLTEEQINILIAISEQRMAKNNGEVVETVREVPDSHSTSHDHDHLVPHDIGNGQEVTAENSVAIILTDDGGVKVTDNSQQDIYFSPQHLEQLEINVNNLTEENVQQLVQMAMPSISIKSEEIAEKEPEAGREEEEEGPSTSYQPEKTTQTSLIGQTVHIQMPDNRIQAAIVRYIRGNLDYKIQFLDGSFAYATPDQIILPKRSQHAGQYSTQRVSIPSSRGNVQKRANEEPADNLSEPPVLKRSYQMSTIVEPSHLHQTPNFCCPICDKKVFQKEPSYIVIRLPACDSCTREKIIVLDEPNS